ncbi:MAG: hemolysin family protein [Coprothermobacterota bacterium]|nr:hemolysin family protein [Coprothermobacterota bacterium]
MDDWSNYLAPALILLSFLFLAGFSSTGSAFISVSKARLRKELEKSENRRLYQLTQWRDNPEYTLAVLLVGEYIFILSSGILSFWWLKTVNLNLTLFWLLLILFLLLVILIEVLMRSLGASRPTGVLLTLYPLVAFWRVLLFPLAGLLRLIGSAVTRWSSNEELEDGTNRVLAEMREEVEDLQAEEREMISAIFEFREKEVSEIMVPRVDVIALDEGAAVAEALQLMVRSGHSRLPVYRESIDNVVGVVLEKDALRALLEKKEALPVSQIMREPFFVPETKKISELLPEMQQRKTQIAFVVDEFGGLEGLVTMEDLLEEIVGEIRDEYDVESERVEKIGEGVFLVSAGVTLRELSEITGVEIESEDYDTLGGLLLGIFQRIPAVGEETEYNSLRFQVVELKGNRLLKIKVEIKKEEKSGD